MPRNCANSYGNVVPVPRLHKVRQLMLKRPFKSLIARIAIVALALSLVVPFVPAAFAQDTSIHYAENGTGPVQTFTLSDQDASSGGWTLSGDDAGDFAISAGGALSFKSSPNYEDAADANGDNVYNVTVNRAGGSLDVTVMVTNVDEGGSVSINDLQPQAGESVSATASDPDGSLERTMWQWSKSMDMDMWMDIDGAASSTYTPASDDVGYYLQAMVSYSDGVGSGRDSAMAVTAFAVEERPTFNSKPSFAAQDEKPDEPGLQVNREVKETAEVGSSVGNAVTATDADNDPLLYSLTTGDGDDESTEFKIDARTGQISVKEVGAGFDREGPDREENYGVTVTATDPSGSKAEVKVTINVVGVNEAPTIDRTDDVNTLTEIDTSVSGDKFVVETLEEARLDLGTSVPGGGDPIDAGLPVFDADDPDNSGDDISWSVGGADGKRFDILKLAEPTAGTSADSSAALRWAAGTGPSFEAMDSADGDNVYVVVVTASDGSASSSETVTVTVKNKEEPGSVTLSQRRPQEGIAITARLSDPDGGITGAKWQWYNGDDTTAPIDGATSSTYIPTAADHGKKLTVQVMYTDGYVTDVDPADGFDDVSKVQVTSEHDAEERPDENARPSFGDDESVSRDVDENAKGASVGEAVTATDADSDPLMYSLSGDGSDAFSVDNSGQITTAMELDYEGRSSYSIMLHATDPSLADASIMVNITVNDTDDPATIVPATENSAPTFDGDSVTLSVDENTEAMAPVGDPIVATDKDGQEISYSLDDDSVVEVWPGGQLTVASGANLDYESATSHTVTLTASDGIGGSSITVTINVNNVGLDNAYDTDDNGEISRNEAIAAADDYFLDNITRDEVLEILALYFG